MILVLYIMDGFQIDQQLYGSGYCPYFQTGFFKGRKFMFRSGCNLSFGLSEGGFQLVEIIIIIWDCFKPILEAKHHYHHFPLIALSMLMSFFCIFF